MYVTGDGELASTEGTTQGDPLAMAMYALAIKPLIDKLRAGCPDVHQAWYANDATGASTCTGLRKWWDELTDHGPSFGNYPTSFPGLSYEDEGRDEKALVWAGHVTTQKMAVFDSYSSRSGEIFFNEIYKSSKQINSQKTSQSILFMCSEVWHESAEISDDPVYVF